jgi:hypothetical protein
MVWLDGDLYPVRKNVQNAVCAGDFLNREIQIHKNAFVTIMLLFTSFI